LIDLTHLSKWDVQHRDLSQIKPSGFEIPETPGDCRFQGGVLIGRLNRIQALVWHLTAGRPEMSQEKAVTDVTEASALLALVGQNIFSIAEKITPLDLSGPAEQAPVLVQGPVLRLPAKVVILGGKDKQAALLMACSRGYGQSFADAVLDAGSEWGLHPAGEKAFSRWMES
jgi:hypothetical protein